MPLPVKNSPPGRLDSARGFSLLEMLVSVAIILLLMSAVFPFIFQVQKRFQGNQVVSESNQSARAALEVMSQEIGQAGFNPNFYPYKTSSDGTLATASAAPRCVTLTDITGINPGDWVSVDTGTNNELVKVVSTSGPPSGNTAFGACGSPNQIQGIFQSPHPTITTTPMPIASYKMPFGGGILQSAGTSNDQKLEFFGDINQSQTGAISYVVYSISPMVPSTTVCSPTVAPGVACSAANTYTLYNLYRSITDVPFTVLPLPSGSGYTAPPNNSASPMVEKVLYNSANAVGPTGKPIFAYPNLIVVGVIPNQITVVGTIVITLCVAVNPRSLETNVVSWYTMATQIRPLNLTAAINVNNSGGGKFLALIPASLPMTNPTGYYP